MSETTMRPLAAIPQSSSKPLKRNPIPPPPKIAWLALDQLVIDETYQRGLSEKSIALIRRLVERWDWNCFKPLSVAASGEGRYEIIDGQHTAIAAATHGAIETLPCLVLDAKTVAERARAFVGINRDRVGLSPFALYRSRLAGEDPEAIAVGEALATAGCRLAETFKMNEVAKPGDLSCVSTLLQVVRAGGQPRLTRILRICRAADVAPIASAMVKGLEAIITVPDAPADDQLAAAIKRIGGTEVLRKATQRREAGVAATGADAVSQVLLFEIERMAATRGVVAA